MDLATFAQDKHFGIIKFMSFLVLIVLIKRSFYTF